MSRSSAIAAVSATLGARLTKVLDGIPGIDAKVSHTRPGTNNVFGSSKTGVHLFLYMVTPNPALRNNDLPARDANGKLMQRPTAALELHYLLSFVGDAELDPQLMLGAITVDLHANPTLTPDEITAATQGKPSENSRLAQQIERVRLTSEAINLEEFSKLWSVFFQTQYLLSVAYKASVVLLEAEVDTPVPAPVRSRDVWSTPLPPTISAVAPAMIGVGGRLRLHGGGFLGASTRVRFVQADGIVRVADPVLLLDDRLEVDLPAGLSAGLTAVAVVTNQDATSGESQRSFELESSEAAFTVVPRLLDSSSQPLVTVKPDANGKIKFKVSPKLAAGQQLSVLLGSLRVAPTTTTPAGANTNVTVKLPTGLGTKPIPLRVAIDRTASLVEPDGAEFKPRLLPGGP